MKAMILAAGLGTRLKPLTDTVPKSLVQVKDREMLGIVIRRIQQAGINDMVINIHHKAPMVIDFLEKNRFFGANIRLSDETGRLLDTGGGLKQAAHLLRSEEPVLIHNVDVISDIPLNAIIEDHCTARDGRIATLAVNHRDTSREFLLDKEHAVCGWRNNTTGEIRLSRNSSHPQAVSFACMYVVNPGFLDMITETGVFSIIDVFIRLAGSYTIQTYPVDQYRWIDIGNLQNLNKATVMFADLEQLLTL